MEDGWKITHFLELSSSLYCSHHQPITPFLEDMADFFTYRFIYPQIRNYAHHIMNWWSKSTSYPSPSFSCPVDNRQLGNNVFSLSAVLKS